MIGVLKLNIREVLFESISFYRNNLKHLWGFSAIYAVCHGLMLVEHPWIGYAFFMMVFYGPLFYLAMMAQINSLMKGERISFIQAHKRAEGNQYCAILLLLFLMMLVWHSPFILLLALNSPLMDIVAILYTTSVGVLFYMLIPVIALSNKTIGRLKETQAIMEGNYQRISLLYALTTVLLRYIFLRIEGISFDNTIQNMIDLVYIIALFFIFPFSQVVAVMVYKKLTKEQESVQQQISVDEPREQAESDENK